MYADSWVGSSKWHAPKPGEGRGVMKYEAGGSLEHLDSSHNFSFAHLTRVTVLKH